MRKQDPHEEAISYPFYALHQWENQVIPREFGSEDQYFYISNSDSDAEYSDQDIDETIRDDPDFAEEYNELKEELEGTLLSNDPKELREKILEKMGFTKYCFAKIRSRPEGFFYTKEAGERYLKRWKHHFPDDPHLFCYSLVENPELKTIREFLLQLGSGE